MIRDVGYAIRSLRRSPAFTIAAILTLSIGIGAATAIYSIVDAILFRPLPFPGGDRLVRLVEYGPRYKRSLGAAASALEPPASVDDVEVEHRLKGDAGTEFGVPSALGKDDRAAVSEAELDELVKLLKASWRAFDRAADKAKGKTLAAGPRGGGRSLDKIRAHVDEAEGAYIGAIGAKSPRDGTREEFEKAFIEALQAKQRGELPDRGPRGGERWPVRYAVRRSAWHALDHAWEIEDRSS